MGSDRDAVPTVAAGRVEKYFSRFLTRHPKCLTVILVENIRFTHFHAKHTYTGYDTT